MLNALPRLELSVDAGSGGGCKGKMSAKSFDEEGSYRREEFKLPAAAAASVGDFLTSAGAESRGLRSRASDRLAGGDRERLSNLEALRGSGSV